MNENRRLKEVRKKLGLTQQQLADKIGVKWHKIKDIEIGKSKLSVEIADKIRDIFSISFDWLLTGKGPMYLNDPQKSQENNIIVSNIGNNIKGDANININIQTHKKDVTQKEDELIEAYRLLPTTLQDYYYHRIQTDVLEIKLKSQKEENEQNSNFSKI